MWTHLKYFRAVIPLNLWIFQCWTQLAGKLTSTIFNSVHFISDVVISLDEKVIAYYFSYEKKGNRPVRDIRGFYTAILVQWWWEESVGGGGGIEKVCPCPLLQCYTAPTDYTESILPHCCAVLLVPRLPNSNDDVFVALYLIIKLT